MMMMMGMFCCFLTEANVSSHGQTSPLTATDSCDREIVENADVTFTDVIHVASSKDLLELSASQQGKRVFRRHIASDHLSMQSILSVAFQEKCLRLLEKQQLEILEIKALLVNLRQGPNHQPAPDFSAVPPTPLQDENALRELEVWLDLQANKSLMVSYSIEK
jgi:hypothetical protein